MQGKDISLEEMLGTPGQPTFHHLNKDSPEKDHAQGESQAWSEEAADSLYLAPLEETKSKSLAHSLAVTLLIARSRPVTTI